MLAGSVGQASDSSPPIPLTAAQCGRTDVVVGVDLVPGSSGTSVMTKRATTTATTASNNTVMPTAAQIARLPADELAATSHLP
jgi:hypothetical protein